MPTASMANPTTTGSTRAPRRTRCRSRNRTMLLSLLNGAAEDESISIDRHHASVTVRPAIGNA